MSQIIQVNGVLLQQRAVSRVKLICPITVQSQIAVPTGESTIQRFTRTYQTLALILFTSFRAASGEDHSSISTTRTLTCEAPRTMTNRHRVYFTACSVQSAVWVWHFTRGHTCYRSPSQRKDKVEVDGQSVEVDAVIRQKNGKKKSHCRAWKRL